MPKFYDSIHFAILENTGWDDVQSTKFAEHFRKNGIVFTDWHGETHPSGPNYRTMLSGVPWSHNEYDGIRRPNVAANLKYTVLPFAGMPAIRHNPFLDLNPTNYHPASGHDLVYYGMDDTNNAHSGPLATADDNMMRAIQNYETAKQNYSRSAFFLLFDEAFGYEYLSNHVFVAIVGTDVKVGTQITCRLSHANFAQFLADNWGLTLKEIPPEGRTYMGKNLADLT